MRIEVEINVHRELWKSFVFIFGCNWKNSLDRKGPENLCISTWRWIPQMCPISILPLTIRWGTIQMRTDVSKSPGSGFCHQSRVKLTVCVDLSTQRGVVCQPSMCPWNGERTDHDLTRGNQPHFRPSRVERRSWQADRDGSSHNAQVSSHHSEKAKRQSQ